MLLEGMQDIKSTFYLQVDGELTEVEISLEKVFVVNEHDIKGELLRHASIVAWFGMIHNSYQQNLSALRGEQKIMDAELYGEKKTILESAGARATVDGIKAEVIIDARMQAMNKRIRDTESDVGALFAIKNALDHKKDMLIQLGGLHKREMDLQSLLDLQAVHGGA